MIPDVYPPDYFLTVRSMFPKSSCGFSKVVHPSSMKHHHWVDSQKPIDLLIQMHLHLHQITVMPSDPTDPTWLTHVNTAQEALKLPSGN